MRTKYSDEYKQQAVQKLLASAENVTIEDIAGHCNTAEHKAFIRIILLSGSRTS